MTRKFSKYFLITLLVVFYLPFGIAQNITLQVVSKKTTHALEWTKNKPIEINGQYADIVIKGWDKETIEGVTELIAKHEKKAIALKDVKRLRSIFEEQKKVIYIGNQLTLSNNERPPTATLKTKIQLHVPRNCPIVITNSFGQVSVEGLERSVQITSRFSTINIENSKGDISLNTNFGEIYSKTMSGKVAIQSNRTDMFLESMIGEYTIRSKYGTISLSEVPGQSYGVRIKGEKTNVTFINPDLLAHDFNLSTEFGKIRLPADNNFKYVTNTDSLRQVVYQSPSAGKNSNISVALSFGDVSLK